MNHRSTAAATDNAYLHAALRALPTCLAHCGCADRWHVLWAGLKATGLLRTLSAQRSFLCDTLAPWRRPGMRVLIAGAADAAALETLHAVLQDPGAHYTLADLCQAPLHLARQYAQAQGLSLQVQRCALDQLQASAPWDLVFIHSTLAFLDGSARERFARQLRHDLAPGGLVVCAVRDRVPDQADATVGEGGDGTASQLQSWIELQRLDLQALFAPHPELLGPLLQWLPSYARVRQRRETTMPRFERVMAEFRDAGFEVLQAHRDPGEASRESTLEAPGSITRWIALLALADAPSRSGP